MGGIDRHPPQQSGPDVLNPDHWALGTRPVLQMLNSDLRLQCKSVPTVPVAAARHFSPVTAAPIPLISTPVLEETDIQALKDYLADIDANIMVPQPAAPPSEPDDESAPSEEPPTEDGWNISSTGASLGSKNGGVSIEDRRGIREYLATGYTRRNPDGSRNRDGTWNTIRVDDDFRGRWNEHAEIAGAKAENDLFSVSAAQGSFGTDGDVLGGSGSILGASGTAAAQFSFTQEGVGGVSPGLRAHAGTEAQAEMIRGQIETRQEYIDSSQTLASGQASGSAASARFEGRVETVLTAEQATLGGKLGAEVNLLEGRIGGDLVVTPRRVVNNGVSVINWVFRLEIPEPLDENWDIGLTVGGEVSGQLGAQAGAEARVGYENGRARAEAGAKIGLGIGAGVKGRVGVVGIDKIWNGVQSVSSAAWDGTTSAANSAWNWAWRD